MFAHSRAAFTLTELLVSLTLLTALVCAAAVCLQTAGRAGAATRRQLAASRQLRAATRSLTADCRHAIVSGDTPWLLNPPAATVLPPADLAPSADGDALFFFTGNPTAGHSGLCATGYYLAAPAGRPRELRRYFQPGAPTWRAADGKHGFLPHALDPARLLWPHTDKPTAGEPLLTGLKIFRLRPRRADGTAPVPWPPAEKPAWLDLTLEFKTRESTREFNFSVPCQ
ncbi:MAG: hypothetical protein LBK71_06630 [Verrucomicrobiales bacterium]|jgi:type II secretory pathway pseudopilin PulG|nr:hypothetical protein [Verrucomicrobiales bacterium]